MPLPEYDDELDLLSLDSHTVPGSPTVTSRSSATTPTLHGSQEPEDDRGTPATSTSTRKLRVRPLKAEDSVTVQGLVKNRKRTLLDFVGFEAHPNVQNLAKKPKIELKKPSERKSDKKAVCLLFLERLHTTEH